MPLSLHRRRVLECLLVFAALPALLVWLNLHRAVFGILWLATLIIWQVMKRDYAYDFHADWNRPGFNRDTLRTVMKRFFPCAVMLLLFLLIAAPNRLFSLPLQRPLLWVMIMILYPALSVVPQELIFRSFFLKRYANLFSTPQRLHIASALAFGWMHVVLLNWVAIVFAAAGGWLFADTYSKTRSLAAASFEHALYGCYLFTIGLGFYFYHGIWR